MKRPLSEIAAIEVTNSCNFSCPSCVSWYKKGKDFITLEMVEKACKMFNHFGFLQVQLYWRGEPCLHPQLPEIAEIVQAHGLISIVCTNGHTPNNSDAEWMKRLMKHTNHYAVCLDGWNRETISNYRYGSDWDLFFRNLDIIKDIDGGKILKTLMFSWNTGKEHVFEEIAQKYGMTCQMSDPDVWGKKILTEAEAAQWIGKEKTSYKKTDSKDLPEVTKWRGKEIHRKDFTGDVWVYSPPEKCVIGNIYVSAKGEIPVCSQMADMNKTLGTVWDDPDLIMKNYKKNQTKLYNKQFAECKYSCLCLREQ